MPAFVECKGTGKKRGHADTAVVDIGVGGACLDNFRSLVRRRARLRQRDRFAGKPRADAKLARASRAIHHRCHAAHTIGGDIACEAGSRPTTKLACVRRARCGHQRSRDHTWHCHHECGSISRIHAQQLFVEALDQRAICVGGRGDYPLSAARPRVAQAICRGIHTDRFRAQLFAAASRGLCPLFSVGFDDARHLLRRR